MIVEWKREGGSPPRLLLIIDGEVVRRVGERILSEREALSLPDFSREAFEQALSSFEEKGGMRIALSLLSKQAYHSSKLKEHLKKHCVASGVIEKIIQDLTLKGFLNDEEWVERRVETLRSRGKSNREISFKLKAVKETPLKLGSDVDALEKIIRKKYSKILHAEVTHKEKVKVYNSLLRRGFSLQDIQNFLYKNSKKSIITEEEEFF